MASQALNMTRGAHGTDGTAAAAVLPTHAWHACPPASQPAPPVSAARLTTIDSTAMQASRA